MVKIILFLCFFSNIFALDIFVNQVGYEKNGYKDAVVRNSSELSNTTFVIIDNSNNEVYSGNFEKIGSVDGWNDGIYYRAVFSDFKDDGTYKIKIDNTTSYDFVVSSNILFSKTSSMMVDFFYNMRNTMNEDKSIGYYGGRSGTHDVYGGWNDASGDQGKYLSHLSWANYMNPQQIPLVVWSLASGYEMNKEYYDLLSIKVKEEAVWGADYLLRVLDEQGYFYINVFDGWGWDPPREICAWVSDAGTKTADYQSGFREGGGMAIAALAKCASMNISGDSSSSQYLAGAVRAYNNIKINNKNYIDDGEENIIDDYCALMACVELYKATNDQQYITDAKVRVQRIIDKQDSQGFLYSDDSKTRPFYHAVDEGLVVVSLYKFLEIDKSLESEVTQFLDKLFNWYKTISYENNNPFNYVKVYYKEGTSAPKTAYFMPHNNETGYWWQGENARVSSMSSAYLLYMLNNNISFGNGSEYEKIAVSQLNWICGENPKNISMIYGAGDNNYPDYTTKSNVVGGICNGITSKESDETGYQFMSDVYSSSDWHNWRWVEQWLPHNAWYFYAINLYYKASNTLKVRESNSIAKIEKDIEIYPNPFNPIVNIVSPNRDYVLKIYNVNGQLLKTLQGKRAYVFDASRYSTGVYFIKGGIGSQIFITKKMVYLK